MVANVCRSNGYRIIMNITLEKPPFQFSKTDYHCIYWKGCGEILRRKGNGRNIKVVVKVQNVCVMTVLMDCSGLGVRAVINDYGRGREILSNLKN